MKRHLLPFVTTALVLSGCAGDPEGRVEDYIQQKKYKEAINWLKDELNKKPDNLLFSALLAETAIQKCITENCFDNNEQELKRIEKYLTAVPVPQVRTEEGFRTTHNNIFNLGKGLIGTDMYPRGLIELTKATPIGPLRDRLVELLFVQACQHIKNNEIPAAMSLLEGSEILSEQGTDLKTFSPYLASLIEGNKDKIAATTDRLRQLEKSTQPPKELVKIIPYLFYYQAIDQDPVSGTSKFLNSLPQEFTNWVDTPLQGKEVRETVAQVVKNMATDKDFMDQATRHMLWNVESNTPQPTMDDTPTERVSMAVTGESPIITETTENSEDDTHTLKLRLLRTAITLHPQNQGYWQEFITPAISYVQQTADASLLFSGASSELIPAEIIQNYNDALFTLIDDFTAEQKNILPLISKIIIPSEGGEDVREKAGNILREALDKALESENYDLVQIYSESEPEIARLSRQKIVTFTIDSLENKWKNNEFAGMTELANFLTKKMGIDFSLDSLLLQSFDEHLKNQNLSEKLSAESIEPLLTAKEESKIQPDEKLLFLRQHFKETPEVIDNILKSYIVKASGNYGTANALYQMFDLFDEKSFPEKERRIYLANSIKSSLSKDESLDALQIAKTGYEVHKMHENIPLVFIASEIINRIQNLNEGLTIWREVPEDLRNSLSASRPQYATLMEAVEAYENNDRIAAGNLFTLLTNEQYKEMAKPYIQEYLDITSGIEGIYSAEDADANMSSSYIHIAPVSTLDNITPENSLLNMNMTFVSSIGRVLMKSSQDLTEDYSKVFTYTLKALLNPETMEITVTKDLRNSANLPQSFDKIFGAVRNLRFVNDRIILTAGPQFYTLNRVEKDSTEAVFPAGKFGIIKTLREADETVSQVLPLGSILEFKVQKTKALQTMKAGRKLPPIYPVKGLIKNPIVGSTPLKMEGFYSPERHTFSLSYDLPLSETGNIKAALRCQIVDTLIQCAAHNKRNSRQRFNHLVSGREIEAGKPSADLKKLMQQPSNGFSSAKRKAYIERQKREQNR